MDQRQEGYKATGSRAEMEAEEDDNDEEEGNRDRDTPRGAPVEVIHVRGDVPPPEKNADLPEFTPGCVHLLLREVYEDFPHHNDRSHLDGVFTYNAIWKRRWHRLAAQSASWYAMPSGSVGRRFTAILAVEWHGILGRSWNNKRPLVFTHVVLMNILSVRRAKEIHARITRRMDLWERGLHVGLVGDAKAEGAAREVRAASGG